MVAQVKSLNENAIRSFFLWGRPNRGYRWVEPSEIEQGLNIGLLNNLAGPFMVEDKSSLNYVLYHPLEEEPTLFLKFAACATDLPSILDFANQYGCLREVSTDSQFRLVRHFFMADFSLVRKRFPLRNEYDLDSLDFWRNEIEDMRKTVQIWEWLSEQNESQLAQIIKWKETDSDFIQPFIEWDRNYIASSYSYGGSDSPLVETFGQGDANSLYSPLGDYSSFIPGDLFLPARYLIQNRINEKMIRFPSYIQLAANDEGDVVNCIQPRNLLAAMWLQFFAVIGGTKKVKRCSVCGEWEDVSNNRSTWTKHPECAAREKTARYRQKKQLEDSDE